MARTAIKVKCFKKQDEAEKAWNNGKKPKKRTKVYNRCKICGDTRSYMRKFEICRHCFRELANAGEIMGVTKSSW
jgi:small subunit ribosomal protein S14